MGRSRLVYLVPFVLAGLLPSVFGQQATPATSSSSIGVAQHGHTAAIATGLQATATRFVTVQIITSTLGLSTASTSIPAVASTTMAAANTTAGAISAASNAVSSGPVVLDTKVGPAFGILGAFLIISGLALAITGSAHRRLAVFVITIYTWALVTFVLILHFGVEKQVSVPTEGIRVAFLMASLAAGVIFGVASVIFHRGTKVIIAPVAGFLFGVVIQSLRNDGLIRQIGLRYLLYLALTGVAFIIGIIPRCIDGSILVSTAFLGALAFVIGVDCFSTANLKEFFVYNLGFSAIFPRLDNHFIITSAMQIELGIILLVFAISIATQIRLFNLFEYKLSALTKRSEREKNANEEEKAASRIKYVMNNDVEKFEHRYSRGFPFSAPPTEQGSPSLNSPTLQTPKLESAPLLPELDYVSSGKHNIKDAAASAGFLGHVKGYVGGKRISQSLSSSQTPVVPIATAPEMEKKDSTELAQEIMDQEKALQEIALLRQKIGQQRDSLRPGSSGSESSTAAAGSSVPFPEAAFMRPVEPQAKSSTLPGHRQTVSLAGISSAQQRRPPSFAAPRPISQHSLIISPTLSNVSNFAAASSRPPNHHTISSPTIPSQTRRMSTSYANDTLTRHQRAQSSGAFTSAPMTVGRSPSNNSLAGPQRIVTGTLSSRPSSQTLASGGMTRTQTMDIAELEARHRRRLSQLQGGARNSLVVASAKPAIADGKPSRTLEAESSRKRSSTLAGISQAGRQASEKRQSRIDEFGRPVSSVVADKQISSVVHPAQQINLPKQADTAPVKKSPSDWLSY